MPTEIITTSRRDLLAEQFGDRRAKLLADADSVIQLFRRHTAEGVELSTDERERQRRREHCAALIRLTKMELAAITGESAVDRRNRLRRTADRAEYLQLASDAERRGDHEAATNFESWAEAAKFRELLGAEAQ